MFRPERRVRPSRWQRLTPSAARIACASASHRRVEPSTSVNKNVTTPEGAAAAGADTPAESHNRRAPTCHIGGIQPRPPPRGAYSSGAFSRWICHRVPWHIRHGNEIRDQLSGLVGGHGVERRSQKPHNPQNPHNPLANSWKSGEKWLFPRGFTASKLPLHDHQTNRAVRTGTDGLWLLLHG